jgi:hypothetical protein
MCSRTILSRRNREDNNHDAEEGCQEQCCSRQTAQTDVFDLQSLSPHCRITHLHSHHAHCLDQLTTGRSRV